MELEPNYGHCTQKGLLLLENTQGRSSSWLFIKEARIVAQACQLFGSHLNDDRVLCYLVIN